jgi:hypothetical protein
VGPQGPQGEMGPQGPQGPPGGGGLTVEQVQVMIDATIEVALRPIYALLAEVPNFGALVALKSCGEPPDGREGLYLSADGGGPAREGEEFRLTGKTEVHAWESWTLTRGTR